MRPLPHVIYDDIHTRGDRDSEEALARLHRAATIVWLIDHPHIIVEFADEAVDQTV